MIGALLAALQGCSHAVPPGISAGTEWQGYIVLADDGWHRADGLAAPAPDRLEWSGESPVADRCELGPAPEAPWSLPVWRADGQAMFRRTSAGIVYDGDGICGGMGSTATSAAFVGNAGAWTDGHTVRLDEKPVWEGTQVRLMMAAGAAWVLAGEGFGDLTENGVTTRETTLGLASPWEMPHGVCLVDDSDGFIVLQDPPAWGARCWRPGAATRWEYPRGTVPLDVDVAVERETRVLRNLTTGEERTLPPGFPIDFSTRPLPDGRLRTFSTSAYWELTTDGAVRELRWSADDPVHCADCGAQTWREPAEIR